MTSVVHPAHPVPHEVAEALHEFRQSELEVVGRQHEAAALARPTDSERAAAAEAYAGRNQTAGDHEKQRKRFLKAMKDYPGRLPDSDRSLESRPPELFPLDYQPSAPERIDSSFWWARTDWFHPNFYSAESRPDGLHFTGRFTYDSGSLLSFNFGAVSIFELQWERLPPSPSGRWRSSPHVELFGGLLGWTGRGDIFTGDCWCKCWMIRRQTLLQFRFGPTGPVPLVLGERIDRQTMIFEENANRAFFPRMPGFQWMPSVVFANPFPQSIWAHIEVRFDCQLEGSSLLWLDPEVLLRGFQWPVTPA